MQVRLQTSGKRPGIFGGPAAAVWTCTCSASHGGGDSGDQAAGTGFDRGARHFGAAYLGAGEQQLRDVIQALANQGKTNVLLNLDGLVFMDSAGLGSLVVGSKLLQGRGGKLQIVNARGPVQHVFQITRLTKVFPIHPDEEGALAASRREQKLHAAPRQ